VAGGWDIHVVVFQPPDLADALRKGLGIGVVPINPLQAEVAAGRLVHVLPGYTWGDVPMFALVPQGRIRVPRVRVVLDWVQGFVASRLM